MFLNRANAIPMDNSAAAIILPSGVFTTNIPFLVQASTSILSIPFPARPTTLRFLPFSITSFVTFVPLLTIIAS